MARTYDAYNRFRSETSSSFFTNPGTCASGPSYGNAISSMNYWPSGHPAQAVSSAGGIVQQNETVHWDGDRPLFISFAGLPANAHIYIGTEGAVQINGTSLTALDVFDRDWSGNMVTTHWVQKGTVGYSSWQQFSVKSPTPGGKGQISGTCYYPILGSGSPPPGFTVCNLQTQVVNYPYETSNESIYPIPRRDEGLELGQISVQGVRTMDVSTTQWTTPDAYAGDVHDPMSQRPFMWNGNNPYSYSDPSGYAPVPRNPGDLNRDWVPVNTRPNSKRTGNQPTFRNTQTGQYIRFRPDGSVELREPNDGAPSADRMPDQSAPPGRELKNAAGQQTHRFAAGEEVPGFHNPPPDPSLTDRLGNALRSIFGLGESSGKTKKTRRPRVP